MFQSVQQYFQQQSQGWNGVVKEALAGAAPWRATWRRHQVTNMQRTMCFRVALLQTLPTPQCAK